jgi:hypothetical protein
MARMARMSWGRMSCPAHHDLLADAVQITKISPSLNHILPPGSALLWLATLAIIEALIFTYWAILTLPIVRPHTHTQHSRCTCLLVSQWPDHRNLGASLTPAVLAPVHHPLCALGVCRQSRAD